MSESKRARGRRLQRERAQAARAVELERLRKCGAEVFAFEAVCPPLIQWSGLPPKRRYGSLGAEYLWT